MDMGQVTRRIQKQRTWLSMLALPEGAHGDEGCDEDGCAAKPEEEQGVEDELHVLRECILASGIPHVRWTCPGHALHMPSVHQTFFLSCYHSCMPTPLPYAMLAPLHPTHPTIPLFR